MKCCVIYSDKSWFVPVFRWVLSCSMDSTLRVWDLLSATCLGVMSLDSPAVSISLSPQSDILATVHIEESHIRLWANVSIFGSGDTLPVLDQVCRENSLFFFFAFSSE